jgi:protein-S-isoprenylcysteine O-methyltransferase Ste14
MSSLELKIPPPVLTLLVAAAMWGLARVTPLFPTLFPTLPPALRVAAAVALAAVGMVVAGAGVVRFRRANTTRDPVRPESASSLVTGGIYRVTRNPMYLGLTLVLAGWAVYLGAPWAWLGPVLFVAWITRFQIIPEERALAALFGAQFAAYRGRVRRWL